MMNARRKNFWLLVFLIALVLKLPASAGGTAPPPTVGLPVLGGTAYRLLAEDASGNLANVASLGSSGNVLTSNGAGALPTWQAAGSGITNSATGTQVLINSSGNAAGLVGSSVTSNVLTLGSLTIATAFTVNSGVVSLFPQGSSSAPSIASATQTGSGLAFDSTINAVRICNDGASYAYFDASIGLEMVGTGSVGFTPTYGTTATVYITRPGTNQMAFLTASTQALLLDASQNATFAGRATFPATLTGSGTTGNQTINKPSGSVRIAAAGTTVTVTDSLVTANSIVLASVATADATAYVKEVIPSAGSFVINVNAVTAETEVRWVVFNN